MNDVSEFVFLLLVVKYLRTYRMVFLAVPIPVVASFRKIKNLVKNHGVVAAALRNSSQLVSILFSRRRSSSRDSEVKSAERPWVSKEGALL